MDRTSRLPSRPTSVATELIRLVMRLVFFGGLVVLALVIRADETRTGERTFLLALAVLGGVGSSASRSWSSWAGSWGRRRPVRCLRDRVPSRARLA
jgi:hypothetical protein